MVERPNVLRFSCRRGALHQKALKCQRSRAPKAVSCKRLFGGNAVGGYGCAVLLIGFDPVSRDISDGGSGPYFCS